MRIILRWRGRARSDERLGMSDDGLGPRRYEWRLAMTYWLMDIWLLVIAGYQKARMTNKRLAGLRP